MARQKGIIKLVGKVGDISFYKSQDGYLAREKGGVEASRIANDPSFQRTRENGAEFGRAGAAAKLLRIAFRASLMKAADNRMSSRLTKEMVKVIQADATSVRGQRNVIDGESELLQGFEFNDKAKLGSTFFAPYETSLDRPRGALKVTLSSFIPAQMIASPPGATHCKLIYGAADVDFENGTYTANTYNHDEVDVNLNSELGGVTMETSVTPGTTNPIFLLFGIEFLQQVNGISYPLNNGSFNALALVRVDGN
jgi:hypothetical protein